MNNPKKVEVRGVIYPSGLSTDIVLRALGEDAFVAFIEEYKKHRHGTGGNNRFIISEWKPSDDRLVEAYAYWIQGKKNIGQISREIGLTNGQIVAQFTKLGAKVVRGEITLPKV